MNDWLRRVLFLPEQASEYAVRVDHLHYFVIITTMLASTAVGLGAIYFFFRYRRRQQGQLTPHVEAMFWMEGLFVAGPLGIFLLWFAIGFNDFATLSTPPKDAMDIYVMGKQWMWKFNYANGPNALGTLRVPANRPVRLLITSRDVIHSFYVPAFRVKQDALPGRYTQTWFTATRPGSYPIFCAEYCGLSHSGMWGQVIVMPEAEFDAWFADQGKSLNADTRNRVDVADVEVGMEPGSRLVEQGKQIALTQGCAKCHTVDGTQHIGPTWLDLYGRQEKLTNGETVVADEAYLTESMMDPLAKIVAGFDPVMPTYRGRLTPPETAALVEYIKSLRSDRVEPESSKGPIYAPVRGK